MLRLTVLLALASFATATRPTPPSTDPRINVNANWRVVGGSDAADGQFPYMVSLRSTANNHFCGGSIINNRWILSAAHCLIGRSTDNTLVVAGTNTLNAGGTTYSSARIIVHAGFNFDTIQDDIAVINLNEDITFTSVVAAVALNTVTVGAEPAVLSGWGTTALGGPLPNQLQYLNTQTLTHADCTSVWGGNVTENQICAVIRYGEGACHGDSGGPLTLASSGHQVGIVSWGEPCGVGYPDVYARVSAYIDWLAENISS